MNPQDQLWTLDILSKIGILASPPTANKMARNTKQSQNKFPAPRRPVVKRPLTKNLLLTTSEFSNWTAPQKIIPYSHLPVLILQFSGSSHQIEALRRISTFYESKNLRGTYIPLSDSRCKRLCENYEGFNFPLHVVEVWFRALCTHLISTPGADSMFWWNECNEGEIWLLETLRDQGLLDLWKIVRVTLADQATRIFETYHSATLTLAIEGDLTAKIQGVQLKTPPESLILSQQLGTGNREGIKPNKISENLENISGRTPYIISHLPNSSGVKIHELQHAYYHVFPKVRQFVNNIFNDPRLLTDEQRNTIMLDLKRRNYAEEVRIDEFQAYAVGLYKCGEAGFGNKVVDGKMRRLGAVIDSFCQAELVESMGSE